MTAAGISFQADLAFLANAPPLPHKAFQQDRYEERLEQAYRLLKTKPPVNENPKEALSFLSIEPALVPAVGRADGDNNNSGQDIPHQVLEVAKYICNKLLNSTAKHNFNLVIQEDDTSPIKIHHSCTIILRPIAHALQLSIYLFTSNTVPFRYNPDDSCPAIGIFLRSSSSDNVFQFVPLVMARHSPKETQQSPAKKARTGPQELSPPAQFTPTKKRAARRTVPSFDNVSPAHLISALLEACTTYICNRAHAILHKIETKDTFRGPSKSQVLQSQRQSLYRSLLKPSRLPDSIMPNTSQMIMVSCGVTGFIRPDYERLWGKYERLFKRSSYDECTVRVMSEMVEVEDGDNDGVDDLSSTTEGPTEPLTPYDVWRPVLTKGFDELWLDSHARVLFDLQQPS